MVDCERDMILPLRPSHRTFTARLNRSGLGPLKMMDKAKRQLRWRCSRNLGYFMKVGRFVLFVALALAVVSVEMIFFVSNQ